MILEHIFNDFHGKDFINKEPKVMTKVKNVLMHELQIENLHLPVKVVECLVRTRTFIRLNYLNKIILSATITQKNENSRKIKKFQ